MACECCPYGSQGLLVSVQVLAGITLAISICGWWLTWITGLVAFIMIMLLACTTVHPSVVIISGVFSCIAAIGQFVFAAYAKTLNVYCSAGSVDNYYYSNGNRYYYHYTSDTCDTVSKVFLALGVITGAGWVLTAVLSFMLVCLLKDKNDRTQRAWGNRDGPPKIATPAAAVATPTAATTTVNISYLPDGSRRIEETTTNPDGSKTVTVRTEAPTDVNMKV